MFRLSYIHFVLLLLAVSAFSQSTSTTPCKCTTKLYWRSYTFTRTVTGSSSCTSLKLTPTCPTSTSSTAKPTSSVVTTTSSKIASSSSSKATSNAPLQTQSSSSSIITSTSSSKATSSSPVTTPSSSNPISTTSSKATSSSPVPIQSSSSSNPISTTSSKATSSSPAPIQSSSFTTSTVKPSTSSGPVSSSTSSGCLPTPTNKAGTKRGISYNGTPLTNLFSTSCVKSKVSWAYNWYSSRATDGQASAFNNALTFIPMLWSAADDLTSIWNANANAAIANGANALLSFNEPDGCGDGGSCMNVTYAAQSYKKWMQPFAGKARLGSPGVTNGWAPAGLTYLQNFIQACNGCTIDFITIHWYSDASQIDQFKNYIQQAYAAGGNKPLWITEFGCTSGTDAQVQTFMKAVLPWLDSQSYVEKYAYYMALPQNAGAPFLWQETLVNSTGTGLSNTGVIYDQY